MMLPTIATTTMMTTTTMDNGDVDTRRRKLQFSSNNHPKPVFLSTMSKSRHPVAREEEKSTTSCAAQHSSSVTVDENGSAVTVRFAQHQNQNHHHHHDFDLSLPTTTTTTSSVFHASWLWMNDPSFVHATSGQRTRPSATTFYAGNFCIRHAEIIVEVVESSAADEIQQEVAKIISSSNNSPHGNYVQKIPIPPPAPDCLHPIGSVYQTATSRDSETPGVNSSSHKSFYLLKIVWGSDNDDDSNNDDDGDDEILESSYYDLNWLWRCRYDDLALEYRNSQTQVTKQTALRRDSQVVSIHHDNLLLEEAGTTTTTTTTTRDVALFDILHAIVMDGAVIVQNAPTWQDYLSSDDSNCIEQQQQQQQQQETTVGRLGRALGGGSLSHGSLYGDIFHVQSIPDAHNIAYTNQALPPHQDLSYFESKPGLQLLHCLANDTSSIVGGESTLIDAMAAATELRHLAPHLYQVLVQTEATFVKQRHNADMVARRPHIVQDSTGSVVQVSWSPPFEGPACVAPHRMEDYLLAHAALTRMLDKSLPRDQFMLSSRIDPAMERDLIDYAHEYTWTKRLEPGEILIFNNQRMLHGRAAFEYTFAAHTKNSNNNASSNGGVSGGGRHLIGCYTNLDDTLSLYRLLRRRFGKQKSWSSSSSGLSTPSFIRNLGNGFSGGL
jgi:alpha-ketoglutarate-dependent taurine dioxygenase